MQRKDQTMSERETRLEKTLNILKRIRHKCQDVEARLQDAEENPPKKLGIDFIKTTYDISLDSQISLLPRGFSPMLERQEKSNIGLPLGRILFSSSTCCVYLPDLNKDMIGKDTTMS
jgi:hypothetical protein